MFTSATIDARPNGTITLPKEWRSQFPTKHFMAEATDRGLLIKPILNVEYYEDADGSYGLRFPNGMDASNFHAMLKEANTLLDKEERASKKKTAKKPSKTSKIWKKP